MPISYKVIGSHLRQVRKKAGLTQATVAERLDISAKHYGHIERGARPISLDMLGQLCALYAIPLEALVKGALVDVPLAEINGETMADHQIAGIINMMQGCDAKTLDLLMEIVDSVTRFTKA
ncbi:helix-turn-helix transcriptional regulator [Beduinella massiliensis]|uniref:helix-turn-helix domain-containing protein n=1 Tax=Beduinella massiliensis TaxID=1852363 RepID=UPI0031F7F84A